MDPISTASLCIAFVHDENPTERPYQVRPEAAAEVLRMLTDPPDDAFQGLDWLGDTEEAK